MLLSTKIRLFGVIAAVILLFCAVVGYLGINRLSDSIDFISGPAWNSADGAMEGTIGVQSQMLAVNQMTMSKGDMGDQAHTQELLNAGKEMELEAFGRLKAAKLMDPSQITELDEKLTAYDSARDTILQGGDSTSPANMKAYHAASQNLLELVEQLEEIADG